MVSGHLQEKKGYLLVFLLERGQYNPSLKLAMDIAKVFHVTVEDLFEFVDDN